MKRFAVVLAFLGLAAAPASAADIYHDSMKDAPAGVTVEAPSKHSWTQVFAGLGGACETGTTETRIDHAGINGDAAQTFNVFDLQGIGSSGCSAAPFIGADWQIPGSRLVIGAEGEYRFSNDESKLSLLSGQALDASAKIDRSWLLSGRFGALVWADTLVYGRVGFGRADGSWSATFGGSDNHASGDLPTFSTIAYGAGIETRFWDSRAALRLEYRHVDFSKEEVFNGSGFKGTIEPSFDAGLVGLSYRLGQ